MDKRPFAWQTESTFPKTIGAILLFALVVAVRLSATAYKTDQRGIPTEAEFKALTIKSCVGEGNTRAECEELWHYAWRHSFQRGVEAYKRGGARAFNREVLAHANDPDSYREYFGAACVEEGVDEHLCEKVWGESGRDEIAKELKAVPVEMVY